MRRFIMAICKGSMAAIVLVLTACGNRDAATLAQSNAKACGFERPPYVARVRFNNADGSLAKAVTVFGLHVKPNHAYQELQMLSDVYVKNKSAENILLGDFNADCDYLAPQEEQDLRLKALSWLISRGENTNTSNRSSCAYDRIIDDGVGLSAPGIDTGSAAVSDHYIVFATLPGDFRIAAFNMQRYGLQKAANPATTDTIRQLLTRYDLVLLQEITSSKNAVLDIITPPGFAYAVSGELGSTSYKERYAYMYRKDRVRLDAAQSIDTASCFTRN